MQIHIEHDPSPMKLEIIGVYDWPIWTKEVSRFPWTYDQKESCYILEGEVIVTPDGGEPVKIVENDYVTFPAGMTCTWEVLSPVNRQETLQFRLTSCRTCPLRSPSRCRT